MHLTVKLSRSDAAIEKEILSIIRSIVNKAFRGATAAIKLQLGFLCEELILDTNFVDSLLHGELQGDLGLSDPDTAIKAIIARISSSIRVGVNTLRIVGDHLEGGMYAGMIQSDYEDILSLASSSYISEPSQTEIPWLKWLVSGGDQILVYGYDVHFDLRPSEKKSSRSGKALMKVGSGWRLPTWISAFPGDNFLTQAFSDKSLDARIAQIFQYEIQTRLP